ncbi:MAG TPA: response regulator [Methylomirabilota bacterium]|nr:response regulator [Methylomirabilota bacterium]
MTADTDLCHACGKPLGHGVSRYRTATGEVHMRCHHGPRILVIEDEATLRDLITRILERLGYGVDTAADGFAAIPLIGQHDYDVVLSDLRMPQMDGPTLYREIQRIYPEVASRIVFMSAHTNLEEYVPFIREVRAPILGKPFDMKELRETLARMLGPRGSRPAPDPPSESVNGPWLAKCSCGWARAATSAPEADSAGKLHSTMGPAGIAHVTRVERPDDPRGRIPLTQV